MYLAVITAWPVPTPTTGELDKSLQSKKLRVLEGPPQTSGTTTSSLALSIACAFVAVWGSNLTAAHFHFEAASFALIAIVASALGAAGKFLSGSDVRKPAFFAGSMSKL